MQRSTVHLGLASNDACDGHKQRPARSPWVFHYTMWTCITDGRSYPFMIAGKELVSGETWRSVGELLSSSSGRVNCIALDIRTVTWNYPAKNTKPRRHYVSPVQDGCLFFSEKMFCTDQESLSHPPLSSVLPSFLSMALVALILIKRTSGTVRKWWLNAGHARSFRGLWTWS